MSKTVWNIIIIVLIAASLFLGYNFFFGSDGADTLLATARETSAEQNAASELLVILKVLEELRIDAGFLKADSFKALRDFSVALPEGVPGRRNPFAPLEN